MEWPQRIPASPIAAYWGASHIWKLWQQTYNVRLVVHCTTICYFLATWPIFQTVCTLERSDAFDTRQHLNLSGHIEHFSAKYIFRRHWSMFRLRFQPTLIDFESISCTSKISQVFFFKGSSWIHLRGWRVALINSFRQKWFVPVENGIKNTSLL